MWGDPGEPQEWPTCVCVTTDEGDVEVEQRIRALKLFGEELVKNGVYGLWVFYI